MMGRSATNLALFAVLAAELGSSSAFQVLPLRQQVNGLAPSFGVRSTKTALFAEGDDATTAAEAAVAEADAAMQAMSEEDKKEKIRNLVADDEWMGLSMEISEMVRTAIVEDVKAKTGDFIGKDEYKVGDISKEMDARIKDEVARLRDKDEYELGDLSVALDEMSKEFTKELTGKDEYEVGDLSKEIDKRVKGAAANFCGKDEYEVGDLSKEMDSRVQSRVAEFTGNDDYSFGDISREVENRRKDWVKDFLGAEAAENYEFGDITKKAITSFTGNDDYQFGDVTKKVLGNIFGPRKRGGSK